MQSDGYRFLFVGAVLVLFIQTLCNLQLGRRIEGLRGVMQQCPNCEWRVRR